MLRDRDKEAFWRLAFQEHASSGLSIRHFCPAFLSGVRTFEISFLCLVTGIEIPRSRMDRISPSGTIYFNLRQQFEIRVQLEVPAESCRGSFEVLPF